MSHIAQPKCDICGGGSIGLRLALRLTCFLSVAAMHPVDAIIKQANAIFPQKRFPLSALAVEDKGVRQIEPVGDKTTCKIPHKR